MTTTRDYEINSTTISSLDLSVLNPSSEKQEIKMELFESGQLDITIEELDFSQKIRNPHKILLDDSPKIVKTVISGNTIKFYGANGTLLGTENIPIPNHSDLVKIIKDIGKDFSSEDINDVITTMQGHHLIDNLEEFIKDLEQDNNHLQRSSGSPITIIEQGDNFVTLRMPLNNIEPAMSQESVLLIDKTLNKIVGTRIYSNNQLLQSTFFGYNKGEVQSLNAIKTIQKIQLLSGNEIDMISYSKIDDMEFNLNL
ncbi:hypothetical protein [Polaribacter glomeratus]|uniref:Uncharacterized protein n=1 Tax=Polaribacter glomeratus TaxID=102 RepID=A0A2S7WHH9_9FLAO|nr:hypothetical protein [Polaribacter glomeratus]PQJ76761.1 hypothetical protein BTO16_12845 [Polaribacter glomeratus]TXD67397.1 hypothetical protein ESX12_02070 [Polaribacter glomeratus]